MADLCNQCADEIGVPRGDLAGITGYGEWQKQRAAVVFCRGCGSIQVDPDGFCVSEDCWDYHGFGEVLNAPDAEARIRILARSPLRLFLTRFPIRVGIWWRVFWTAILLARGEAQKTVWAFDDAMGYHKTIEQVQANGGSYKGFRQAKWLGWAEAIAYDAPLLGGGDFFIHLTPKGQMLLQQFQNERAARNG